MTPTTSLSVGTFGQGNPFTVLSFTFAVGTHGWVGGQVVVAVTTEDLGKARSSLQLVETARSTTQAAKSARSTPSGLETARSTPSGTGSARSSTLVEGTTRS